MQLVCIEPEVVVVGVEKQGDMGEVLNLKRLHDEIESCSVQGDLIHKCVLLPWSSSEDLSEQAIEIFFEGFIFKA